MTCYVAIWNDRHADVTAHVFSTAEKAVAWAKAQVRDTVGRWDIIDEGLNDAMIAGGWLYHCTYSAEGDSIHVFPCVIDKDVGK